MVRTSIVLTFVILSSVWPSLGHAVTPDADPLAACDKAADAAERGHALPAGLLAAIGRVESGRADAAGHVAPWPWTIDAAGTGSFLASAPAAIAAVRALHEDGRRNIDVGCFQVNLEQHPLAFATLEQAFDPRANADYAADFLTALHRRTGNWADAVAAYHSADPALGNPYRAQVFAQWAGTGAPPTVGTAVVIAGVHIWSPGAPGTAPRMIRIDSGSDPLSPARGLAQ